MRISFGPIKWPGLSLILAAQAALLWQPMREDSATVDEPVMLGAGHSYWHGHRYFLNVEHPPLAQMVNALPVVWASPPTNAAALLDTQPDGPVIARWDNLALPVGEKFPDFYYMPVLEGEEYGRQLVFGNRDVLLWGRLVPVLTSLATTVLVFVWAGGSLLAAIAWAFNPVALAHGHLATTDAAAALCLPLALWMWTRFAQKPGTQSAVVAGIALGAAMLVKFTALALLPAMLIVSWMEVRRHRESRAFVRGAMLAGAVTWAMILLAYAPDWKPAPPAPDGLAVPAWFRALRLVWIPPTFFKGLALVLTHAGRGHESYLLGDWSNEGWWYYFPVAFALKTPVALLALGAMSLRRRALVPWLGAAVYFAVAMTSRANLGIRHLLPVYALLAVAIGAGCRWRWVGGALAAWLIGVAVWTHPLYIQYFSELAGGASNGQRYLLDSNYDWGQDANRLRKYLGDRHVYISYHGRWGALAGINYTCVSAEEARELRDAWLVISATNLMRPEWSWLRERLPDERVAHTLFVYHLP